MNDLKSAADRGEAAAAPICDLPGSMRFKVRARAKAATLEFASAFSTALRHVSRRVHRTELILPPVLSRRRIASLVYEFT